MKIDQVNLYGNDLFGNPVQPDSLGLIADRFLIPPFSVLNTREGWWQDRKRAWSSLGIQGEIGREAKAFSCNDGQQKKYDYLPDITTGTSIFDPVLCELIYRWFCPAGGVLDPFAGGSVRGIIACLLGNEYTGIDLSEKQLMANRDQADKICPNHKPCWIEGDAENIKQLTQNTEADLIFSCPPYFNLEVYSDDARDLSNMNWESFLIKYRKIIKENCDLLKQNRFACFVVGEVRDKDGNYVNLVGETIKAFLDSGLKFYNEGILVNTVGSLPIRITKQFDSGRKLGKVHQNILIFLKGDAKQATRDMKKYSVD